MQEKQIPYKEMSVEEKRKQLFLRQRALLDTFLSTGAITRAQYDKSLTDLIRLMRIEDVE